MTHKGKIIVTISALVIISGSAYLIWKHLKKNETKPKESSTPEIPKTETINTGSANNKTGNAPVAPVGAKPASSIKTVTAKYDGVNTYSIYGDGRIVSTAKKGEKIGTLQGDKNSVAYFVNTFRGPAAVLKHLVTVS